MNHFRGKSRIGWFIRERSALSVVFSTPSCLAYVSGLQQASYVAGIPGGCEPNGFPPPKKTKQFGPPVGFGGTSMEPLIEGHRRERLRSTRFRVYAAKSAFAHVWPWHHSSRHHHHHHHHHHSACGCLSNQSVSGHASTWSAASGRLTTNPGNKETTAAVQ